MPTLREITQNPLIRKGKLQKEASRDRRITQKGVTGAAIHPRWVLQRRSLCRRVHKCCRHQNAEVTAAWQHVAQENRNSGAFQHGGSNLVIEMDLCDIQVNLVYL